MIRPLNVLDLDVFLRLLNQLWPDRTLNTKKTRLVFQRYLEDSNYLVYGFEEEGKLLGAITASLRWAFFYGEKVAIIEDLIVDEACRDRGIGGELVRELEEVLKKRGIYHVELSSDSHRRRTHRFWEELGYKPLASQFRKGLD